MNTEKKTKMSRIAIPEQQYLHLKKKMKEVGSHKTVGEYILHQLDELAIISCENERLASQNEKMKNENADLLKERQQAATQIAASEARVYSLQKELDSESRRRHSFAHELCVLENKYQTLQKANEAKDIEIRKLRSEKTTTENRLQVVEAENELNKSILDYKRTFVGKIKNLFS